MEIWKDIKNYEGAYQISNFGRVKSLDRYVNHWRGGEMYVIGVVRKLALNNVGYYKLNIGSPKVWFTVHRLVAEAFIPNPENKPCINHINGIKTDNRVENLEWCTYKENSEHACRTGLQVNVLQGENGSNVKLTNEIVNKIRDMHSDGSLSQREIGIILGVEYKNINQIVLRKRWKHI